MQNTLKLRLTSKSWCQYHVVVAFCIKLEMHLVFERITPFHIEKYARLHVQIAQRISVKWINNKVQNMLPCSYKELVALFYTTTKIVFECCRQRSFTYSLSEFSTAMHITEWYTVTFHDHWNSKKDRLSFNYRRATTFYSTEVESEPESTTPTTSSDLFSWVKKQTNKKFRQSQSGAF